MRTPSHPSPADRQQIMQAIRQEVLRRRQMDSQRAGRIAQRWLRSKETAARQYAQAYAARYNLSPDTFQSVFQSRLDSLLRTDSQ